MTALAGLVLGLIVLAGWASGLTPLVEGLPGAVPMKANAALLLVLLATALALRAVGRLPRLVEALAGIALAVSLATAFEYVTGMDLGIDRLLASDVPRSGAPFPGRMAVSAVIGFAAAALAVLTLGGSLRGRHLTWLLALTDAVIGGLGILGYVYGAEGLTSVGSLTQIAFPAALGLIVLAIAVVAADSESTGTRLAREPGLAGQLTRRLLLTALFVLPIGGLLEIWFETSGVLEQREGTAVLVVFQVVILAAVGGWTIIGAHRIEIERTMDQRERELLAAALEQARDGVVVEDSGGVITYVNPAFLALTGLAPGEVLGRSAAAIAQRRPGSDSLVAMLQASSSGSPWTHITDVTGPDGTNRRAEVTVTPVRDNSGTVGSHVITIRDVTERDEAEREMRRLSTAIDQSSDAVVITDTSGAIEYVNPAFEQVSGYTAAEALGQNPRILKSGVHGPAFYAAMWATLTSGHAFVGDLTNRRKDGSLFEEEAVISPIRDETGAITSYVAVKRDVTRERASEAARTRAARDRALIASALADLQVLPSVTATAEAILEQVVRLPGITTARLSYFTHEDPVITLAFVRADGVRAPLGQVPIGRARTLFDRAKQGPWVESWVGQRAHPYDRLFRELGVVAVAHAPIRRSGELIGLLSVSSAEANALDLLTESLPALLEFATAAGALVGPSVVELSHVGQARARIAHVITTRAFSPVFQPVIDVITGDHVGYEALTRFADRSRPDIMFADAASAGLGLELELATLKAALVEAARLRPEAWLSLNVSPELLLAGGGLARILAGRQRPVVVEVTEHTTITDYPAIRSALAALGDDVRVAVDDAGSGAANLSHIIELHPSFVKLDISLVRGIDTDLPRQAMVVGLLHFASESVSETIAEGVETVEELVVLRTLGVRLAQGYLLGRPKPAAEWSAEHGTA